MAYLSITGSLISSMRRQYLALTGPRGTPSSNDTEQLTVRLYLSGQKEFTRSEKSLLKAVGKLQTKRVTATRMVCAI